jgi:hypothetical protein
MVKRLGVQQMMLDRADTDIVKNWGTLPSVFYLPPNQRMFPMKVDWMAMRRDQRRYKDD